MNTHIERQAWDRMVTTFEIISKDHEPTQLELAEFTRFYNMFKDNNISIPEDMSYVLFN